MHGEFCPSCRILTNMTVSTSRRKTVDAEGEAKQILTRTLHCETCGSFVRSQDVEEPEDSLDGETTQEEPSAS